MQLQLSVSFKAAAITIVWLVIKHKRAQQGAAATDITCSLCSWLAAEANAEHAAPPLLHLIADAA